MEIGITLYNKSLSGTRPACGHTGNRSDYNFYLPAASTLSGSGGGFWGGNWPLTGEVYFDWNLASDPCGQNSVEFGIGRPAELLDNVRYLMVVQFGDRGLEPWSVFGASVSLKSNDCDDLGREAHTDCMGLNIFRDPPVQGAAILVNKNRGWTMPGTVDYGDNYIEPVYWPAAS
ncbi:hypothetical protein [Nocardioides zeae]